MDYLLEMFSIFTLDKAIEAFANVSLYLYPLLMLFNGKIIMRKLDLKQGVHDETSNILRKMYVTKTLYFLLMLILYIANIILADTQNMAMLVYPIMLMYFGFSFALISIEIKSILFSYKEVRSELYSPIFKRWSFWILIGASSMKVWQLSGGNFGEASQVVAILDLASYGFIFMSVFVFIYFDKKKNIIEKTLKKSRKIVISIKDNVVKSERHIKKRNREIEKLLRLLKLCMETILDKRKTRAIELQIKELELLLITS